MDVKKEIDKLKAKLNEVGKNLQSSINKIFKKNKKEDSSENDDITKPDQPNLSNLGNENAEAEQDSKTEEKDKKKKKHNFTEQDLKRKKIIQFIVVIAIAIFLFAEDEEVVQKVQNAVKENVGKIAGNQGDEKEVESIEQKGAEADFASSSSSSSSSVVSDKPLDSEANIETTERDMDVSEKNEVGKKEVKGDSDFELDKGNQEVNIKKNDLDIQVSQEEELDFNFETVENTQKSEPKKKNMLEIAKKIEKKAKEESKRREYKKVNYLKVGRGLVYNCKGKYWACLNKSEYFNCRDNKEHLDLNKKLRECFPLEVYSSMRDCKIIQIHNINTLKKTDFCKGI